MKLVSPCEGSQLENCICPLIISLNKDFINIIIYDEAEGLLVGKLIIQILGIWISIREVKITFTGNSCFNEL